MLESLIFKRYNLDFQTTLHFFKENLTKTNKLADALISCLDFGLGSFFTLLPENIKSEDIYKFHCGGKTSPLKKDISFYIENLMKENSLLTCIVDDVNTSLNDVVNNDLFPSYGLSYNDEVYYCLDSKNFNQNILHQCLQYSDATWHSLCLLTKYNFNPLNNNILNENNVIFLSKEARFLFLGAYDGESYIIWEKTFF